MFLDNRGKLGHDSIYYLFDCQLYASSVVPSTYGTCCPIRNYNTQFNSRKLQTSSHSRVCPSFRKFTFLSSTCSETAKGNMARIWFGGQNDGWTEWTVGGFTRVTKKPEKKLRKPVNWEISRHEIWLVSMNFKLSCRLDFDLFPFSCVQQQILLHMLRDEK